MSGNPSAAFPPYTPETAAFARGFILSERAVEPPFPNWAGERVGRLHLVRDPRVPFACARAGDGVVAVLGEVIDVRHPALAPAEIVRTGAALAPDALLAETDHWAGRFLLIHADDGGHHVALDASGMRTASYNLQGPFVMSSHARLVADATGAPRNPALPAIRRAGAASRASFSFPGRMTQWQDVVFLTPSVSLHAETRRLTRFWPRARLRPMTPAQAAEVVVPMLRAQMQALAATGRPLLLSLTAGIDSRVSLAACREHREAVACFTYEVAGSRSSAPDLALAQRMAAEQGLRHTALAVGPDTENPFREALAAGSFLHHFPAGSALYARTFPPDAIHIRSNVAETGRAYWQRAGRRPDRLEPAGTARSWFPFRRRECPVHLKPETMAWLWRRTRDPEIVEAFGQWAEAVDADSVRAIDPFDLFYLECRMATWHGPLLLESDIAFDSHSLFNCRALLSALLAVPLKDRIAARAYHRLIERLWPALAAYPINSLPDGPAIVPAPRTYSTGAGGAE